MAYLIRENLTQIIHDSFEQRTKIMRESYTPQSKYDIFLSYNHLDINVAKWIYEKLSNQGYKVYADFIDPSYPNVVDIKTSLILIDKIKQCSCLLYIHSINSKKSKWCPWEIGLTSGLKDFKCAIIPVLENLSDIYEKQEYLLIYPTIETYKGNLVVNYFGTPHYIKTWLKL